jgi:hypothetical protein
MTLCCRCWLLRLFIVGREGDDRDAVRGDQVLRAAGVARLRHCAHQEQHRIDCSLYRRFLFDFVFEWTNKSSNSPELFWVCVFGESRRVVFAFVRSFVFVCVNLGVAARRRRRRAESARRCRTQGTLSSRLFCCW